MARKRPKWAKKGSKWDPEGKAGPKRTKSGQPRAPRAQTLESVARAYIHRKRRERAVPEWFKDHVKPPKGPSMQRRKLIDQKRRIWAHAKLAEGCRICGRRDHEVCLDWHHVGEKHYAAHRWPFLSWEAALEEAVKCAVLCACCHRLVSYKGWDVPVSSKTSGIPNSGGREEIEQTGNLG